MNLNKNKVPILITGSHRSGTSWVGHVLSKCPQTMSVYEPFNPDIGLKKIKDFFLYICEKNENSYEYIIHNFLNNKESLRLTRGNYKFLIKRKIIPKRLIIKDPIASLSSQWLNHKFGVNVLCLIRHPAAFVSSLIRLKWGAHFETFLKQDELMTQYLYPFEALMNDYKDDAIKSKALLWLCIYSVLHAYNQNKNQNWLVKKHEDISLNPLTQYQEICDFFGLEFTPGVSNVALYTSNSENPSSRPEGKTHHFFLNSKVNIKNWKKYLNVVEINTIRLITEPIASFYYNNQDW